MTRKRKLPVLILVNGAAATGKTTISKAISARFSIPYYSKDDFRSLLIDVLGTGDIKWIKKLGHASAEVFRSIMEKSLSNGQSLIIDQVFFSEIISPFIRKLKVKYKFTVIQVFCMCNPDVAFERYVRRSKSKLRNKGFKEELRYQEVKQRLISWKPAEVGGRLITIDTTDIHKIPKQLEKVFEEIAKATA